MRLSKLEKQIIREIANRTVNSYDRIWRGQFVRYRTVLAACCASYWGMPDKESLVVREPGFIKKKVSFSRAVRSLIRKDLVHGLALAWVVVDGKGHQDILQWQGGGRQERDEEYPEITDSVPRFKLLSLSDGGWKIAESLK
jgi:hypothetical protein